MKHEDAALDAESDLFYRPLRNRAAEEFVSAGKLTFGFPNTQPSYPATKDWNTHPDWGS
jgi:hypothetical protein